MTTKPSPWSDEGECSHIIAESFSEATNQMEGLASRLPAMTDEQRRAVIELIYWGMDYGWHEALRNGPAAPWKASRRATAKRTTAKATKHSAIVAAAEAAAGELDIEALAKRFRVHPSTVYRALKKGD
jgi:hypothetical protein